MQSPGQCIVIKRQLAKVSLGIFYSSWALSHLPEDKEKPAAGRHWHSWISTWPDFHVFGMWEETRFNHSNTGKTHTHLHRQFWCGDINQGSSSCVSTVLTTTACPVRLDYKQNHLCQLVMMNTEVVHLVWEQYNPENMLIDNCVTQRNVYLVGDGWQKALHGTFHSLFGTSDLLRTLI